MEEKSDKFTEVHRLQEDDAQGSTDVPGVREACASNGRPDARVLQEIWRGSPEVRTCPELTQISQRHN